ncbi:hypothetical protein [Flavobacterium sp. GCM10023249]|uniref:hypothetical protein n=2 Tax=unclassified Flavobacterium TaxID=196869 RepID=UPI00361FEA7E
MEQSNSNYWILFLLALLTSCTPRANKLYAKDFILLNKTEMAKKYNKLYTTQKVDFSELKENKVYLSHRNNDAFQIVVFSNDHYIYTTQLLPLYLLDSLRSAKLFRTNYFVAEKKNLKIEYITKDIQSKIEEGRIEKDTIFMNENQNGNNQTRKVSLKNKYIVLPDVTAYNFNDFIIVEKQKPKNAIKKN